MKRVVGTLITSLLLVSLVLVACGKEQEQQTTTTTSVKPTQQETTKTTTTPSDKPKYGGTFTRVLLSEPSFDFYTTSFAPNILYVLTNEGMTFGDWTKGEAGGYGSKVTDWGRGYDQQGLKAGLLAESWNWKVDSAKDEVTIVYKLRAGVRFGLNTKLETSRMVNGREVTANDVVYTMKQLISDKRMYIYSGVPELRTAIIEATSPLEVTVKVPVKSLFAAFARLSYWGRAVPPEIIEKYGSMADWRNSVGTGPFMVDDFVSGSSAVFIKNPKYWMTNPIGPGKGDQLPYIDKMRYLIIVDESTRYAAVRTGKVDHITDVPLDDAEQLRDLSPDLKEMRQAEAGTGARWMRVDKPPTSDIKVRHALMLATDFQAINDGLYQGLGVIQTYPFPVQKGYEDLVVSLDDPIMPQSVKDLYTYNPDRAKELLADAGYPEGFKITALMTQPEVDYYSVLKDQWAKVSVELEFDIKEFGAFTNTLRSGTHPNIAVSGVSMAYMYYYMPHLTATQGVGNPAMVNDRRINDAITNIKTLLATDEKAAMAVWGGKDGLYIYCLEQAFGIPTVGPPAYVFWWPWLKNYSGELWLGEALNHQVEWHRFIWIDQAMKKSMGF